MFTVSKERKTIGKIVVLNAEGGVGKTSVMGQAVLEAGDKGVILSCGEDGITSLKNDKQFADLSGINHVTDVLERWAITPRERAKYKAALDLFKEGKGEEPVIPEGGLMDAMKWLKGQSFTTIGLDSITCLMPALRQYCMQVYYYDQPAIHGKGAGANGVKTRDELDLKANGFGGSELIGYMAKEWEKFLEGIKMLRDSGTTVFITTHRATKKGRIVGEENEYDYNFVKMEVNKNHDLGGDLFDISDAFLYGKFDTQIASGKGGKGRAIGGENRVFVTEGNSTIKAKNRCAMPTEIEATWECLKEYLK